MIHDFGHAKDPVFNDCREKIGKMAFFSIKTIWETIPRVYSCGNIVNNGGTKFVDQWWLRYWL
jgi:hypothetical protein